MTDPSVTERPVAVTSPPAEPVTFVCCVEYGSLEEGTIRLVESLRRFGGDFADSTVVAVTPRRGAPLAAETLRRFDELGVDYVRQAPENKYSWMAYVNKYFALKIAEERTDTPLLVWVDSDVLVTAPPEALRIGADVDFAACPRDRNVGTTGPGDEFYPYWSHVATALGMQVEDLPWVTTVADEAKIRLYWNAGIFVYRRSSSFLNAWWHAMDRILEASDTDTVGKLFWTDQTALGFVAVAQHLRLEHLDGSYNYGIASHFKDHLSAEGLAGARMMHYHDCMSPQLWAWFMQSIADPLPAVHRWLAELGPARPEEDLRRRLVKDGYRTARNLRRRLWAREHGAGLLGQ